MKFVRYVLYLSNSLHKNRNMTGDDDRKWNGNRKQKVSSTRVVKNWAGPTRGSPTENRQAI